MAKTLKRIDAGSLHIIILYPRCSRGDCERVRREKKKASSEAQKRLNKDYSSRKLEYLLASNFPTPGSGIFVTLTYEEQFLPADRKEALRQFKYFLKKLRECRRRLFLPEPVVFWAPEVLSSQNNRWHFHCVLDNTGHDYDMLHKCWIYGSVEEFRKIRVDAEKDHASLARYMTKESRECQDYTSKPGLHGWSYTRNARKPQFDITSVPEDYQIEIPNGVFILEDTPYMNQWISYRVIKYSDAASYPRRQARASRKH